MRAKDSELVECGESLFDGFRLGTTAKGKWSSALTPSKGNRSGGYGDCFFGYISSTTHSKVCQLQQFTSYELSNILLV